jgi:hypothetical protein
MAEITRTVGGASLATTVPSHNHMIGPFDHTGEDIKAGDVCYVASTGHILRSLEDQTGTTAAVNDVQTMSQVNGAANPVAGEYVLGYEGQFTNSLLITNTNADVQTAIQALSTVGAGNITVSGAFPNFVFTGASAFAGLELELIEVQSNLIGDPSNMTPVLQITHTTVGQPVGASGAEQTQSKVHGIAPINVKRGNPITLYDAAIFGYSDGNLTPGQKLYLSGTVPGGLATTATLTGQRPVGFAMDTQRVYFYAVS